MSTKLLFILMAISAFLSFISFININSAWSDRKKLHNWFKAAGIIFLLVAGYLLYRVINQSGGGPEN